MKLKTSPYTLSVIIFLIFYFLAFIWDGVENKEIKYYSPNKQFYITESHSILVWINKIIDTGFFDYRTRYVTINVYNRQTGAKIGKAKGFFCDEMIMMGGGRINIITNNTFLDKYYNIDEVFDNVYFGKYSRATTTP